MEVQRLAPLICPKCKCGEVSKEKGKITCYGCSTVFSGGKEFPKDKESFPRGADPRAITGDYIEGTIGVHSYSSSFDLGRSYD